MKGENFEKEKAEWDKAEKRRQEEEKRKGKKRGKWLKGERNLREGKVERRCEVVMRSMEGNR